MGIFVNLDCQTYIKIKIKNDFSARKYVLGLIILRDVFIYILYDNKY